MDTGNLIKQHCVPCEGGVAPLEGKDLELLLKSVEGWELNNETLRQAQGGSASASKNQRAVSITKEFKFKDFVEAMKFVNTVAEIAEQEGHHPDIFISYNHVRFELTTHAIKGLSQNDFILAAKIDETNLKWKSQNGK